MSQCINCTVIILSQRILKIRGALGKTVHGVEQVICYSVYITLDGLSAKIDFQFFLNHS